MSPQGWAAVAAVLYVTGLVALFRVRTWQRRRATGASECNRFSRRDGWARAAGLLFAVAVLAGAAALVAATAGIPTLTQPGLVQPVAVVGLLVAAAGLALAWVAQSSMRPSWRIGANPSGTTPVVTTSWRFTRVATSRTLRPPLVGYRRGLVGHLDQTDHRRPDLEPRAQLEKRAEFGGDYQDHGLIFCHMDGLPLRSDSVTGDFIAEAAACSLPTIRLQDMRHVACSLMPLGGVPVEIVQMILGHPSPAVTRRVYARLMRKATTAQVEAALRASPSNLVSNP